jgi:hypothetical protein
VKKTRPIVSYSFKVLLQAYCRLTFEGKKTQAYRRLMFEGKTTQAYFRLIFEDKKTGLL